MIFAFTSAACNYLPKVQLLVRSIKKFHPEFRVVVALADRLPDDIQLGDIELDEVIVAEEIGIPEWPKWAFSHDIVELSTAIKPFVLSQLLSREDCHAVFYFDPDMVLFSRVDDLVERFASADILLTPHQTLPESAIESIINNEICSLKHGVYNLGFVGVKATDGGRQFAHWWSQRTYYFCHADIPNGLFTDQRWIDLAPAMFDGVSVIRSPRFNVATWNLTTRSLTGNCEGGFFVDGMPLGFYHFTGFDSGAHRVMAKINASGNKSVEQLISWYEGQSSIATSNSLSKMAWAYGYFSDGVAITRAHRLIYRSRKDLQQRYPNPFDASGGGLSSFRRWCETIGRLRYSRALFRPDSKVNTSNIVKFLAPTVTPRSAASRGVSLDVRALLSDPSRYGALVSQIRRIYLREGSHGVMRRIRGVLHNTFKNVDVRTKKRNFDFIRLNPFRALHRKRFPFSLQFQHNGVISGLARIRLRSEGILESMEQAELLVASVGAHPRPLFRKTYSLLPLSLDLVIHTHLLENGPIDLQVIVRGKAESGEWSESLRFKVQNKGELANKVRESLQSHNVPVIFEGVCDAGRYDYADERLQPWFDKPDALATIQRWVGNGEIDDAMAASFRQFVTEGYAILPLKLPDDLIIKVNKTLDDVIRKGYQGYANGSSQRLEHLHLHYPAIGELWTTPHIQDFLDRLFGQPSEPCQSLVYIFGSEQDAHQDTIHLTPFPAGYMCGVWVALEDVQAGSGELEIFPGSHRMPRLYMHSTGCDKVRNGDWNEFAAKVVHRWQKLVESQKFEKIIYSPERGTVLVWHENLMHAGGKRIKRELSRRSMVTHNFARGALVFYDSSGDIGSTSPRASGKQSVG